MTVINDTTFNIKPRTRKGIKCEPLFSAIQVSNYIAPILHITIGKGNDSLQNLLLEMQAAAERFSPALISAKREYELSAVSLANSKEQLSSFNQYHYDYIKELRRLRRQTTMHEEAQHDIIVKELEDLEEQLELLQSTINSNAIIVAENKKKVQEEQAKPENSKTWGQPVRAKLDKILFDHGIDRSGMHGGAIDGNDCRRLMGNARMIVAELVEFVMEQDSRVEGISDQKIEDVGKAHIHYLQALDGFLSLLLTKRMHYTQQIGIKTRQFSMKCMQLERYIGMSVTPKSHIIEDHACGQQERLLGIGDLDESFGERNHQIETRFDSKYGRLRDFKLREKFKAKEQASANYQPVRDRILQI